VRDQLEHPFVPFDTPGESRIMTASSSSNYTTNLADPDQMYAALNAIYFGDQYRLPGETRVSVLVPPCSTVPVVFSSLSPV
jgi:hypothetical protein